MFGERLSEIRKDHDHTQSDLAELLHVSLPAVRAWEQGKSLPAYDTLVTLCRLYNVTSDYLLGLSDDDPVYERKELRARLSQEELRQLADYKAYLLWRRSKK